MNQQRRKIGNPLNPQQTANSKQQGSGMIQVVHNTPHTSQQQASSDKRRGTTHTRATATPRLATLAN
jgi:hypothetical protein